MPTSSTDRRRFDELTYNEARLLYQALKSLIVFNTGIGYRADRHSSQHSNEFLSALADAAESRSNLLFLLLSELSQRLKSDGCDMDDEWFHCLATWEQFKDFVRQARLLHAI